MLIQILFDLISFNLISFSFFYSGYGGKEKGNLAAQMLMLYYVLLYESVRLANMKSILVSPGRKVIRYSHDLLSELPIKFLLATAERDQVMIKRL